MIYYRYVDIYFQVCIYIYLYLYTHLPSLYIIVNGLNISPPKTAEVWWWSRFGSTSCDTWGQGGGVDAGWEGSHPPGGLQYIGDDYTYTVKWGFFQKTMKQGSLFPISRSLPWKVTELFSKVSPLAKIGDTLKDWTADFAQVTAISSFSFDWEEAFAQKKRSLDGNSTRSKQSFGVFVDNGRSGNKRLWLGGVLSEWFGRENDEKHPRKIYCQDSPGGSFKDFWIFFQITKLLFPVRLSGGKISHFSYFQLSEWWFPPKLVSDPLGEMITIWRAAQKPPTMVAHQQGVELHRYVVEFSYSIYIQCVHICIHLCHTHTNTHI